MALQGRTTLMVFAALTLLAVVGTAWLWPRLARPGPVRWLARIGMILLCQLSALLLVAVAVNAYFEFYSSWGEVFGRGNDVSMPSLRHVLAPGPITASQSTIPQASSSHWPPAQGDG